MERATAERQVAWFEAKGSIWGEILMDRATVERKVALLKEG